MKNAKGKKSLKPAAGKTKEPKAPKVQAPKPAKMAHRPKDQNRPAAPALRRSHGGLNAGRATTRFPFAAPTTITRRGALRSFPPS